MKSFLDVTEAASMKAGSRVAVASVWIATQLLTQAMAAESPPASVEEAEQARFDILEFRVLGNSVLPGTTVERAVYSHLGQGRSLADVEKARQALEQVYREAGYGTVFVDIPEQDVSRGIVRLRITEGKVDRIRVTGARYFANGQITAALPALAAGAAPHIPEVQAQLTALNRRSGDRNIVPLLKAGRTPGTVDVELRVEDSLPIHGSLEVNDRYSADTSQWRLNASLSYDNLFQRQHSLSLQYQTAPENPDDVSVIVGSYVFRLGALPETTFALYALESETDVATLGTLSVLGDGRVFGWRAIRQLPAGDNFFHNVTLGIDYKDFLENIRLAADQELRTPISYLNWSVAYTANLRSERHQSIFNIAANFGVRAFGSETAEFADKRFKGEPNYFYVRGSAQHVFEFVPAWSVMGRIGAQFTQNPLVSNEQLALGGIDTVRGYLESTQLGDYGAHATLELRQSSIASLLGLPPENAYFMLFADAGITSLLHALPSQIAEQDLASAGVGLRVARWAGLDLSVDWARIFTDTGSQLAGDDRTHVGVRYSF